MARAAGILLCHLPEGASIAGLGPGGLLEIGERPLVIGRAADCDVVVRGVAIGGQHNCRILSEPRAGGREWLVEHLGHHLPVQVGDALVTGGRRVLREGDLIIPRNRAGSGPFFVFLRFEADRRRSVVLPRIEAAIAAARPDGAAAFLAEVRRWFPSEVLPPPGGMIALTECTLCGASGASVSLVSLHPASFNFVADAPIRPHATLELCDPCLSEAPSGQLARAALAPTVLGETLRALAATGDDTAAVEVKARYARAAPRVANAVCSFCGGPREQVLAGARGPAVCGPCLAAAKARWA